MEEGRLRVFEIRVLSRIYGPNRDRVTGEWRNLNNEALHDLYFSPNIVRVIKSKMIWAGHVACGVYRILVGKREGNDHW
jgi:hypothetical protein